MIQIAGDIRFERRTASQTAPRIVVIGGGFTGAVVVLHLLKSLPPNAAKITIIEPRPLLGAGLAYSATDPVHRVNVPARLLVMSDDPCAFDRWFRESGALAQDPEAVIPDGRAYPRRSVFGVYLDELVRSAAARSPLQFCHRQDRAISVSRLGDGFAISLQNEGIIAADIVVLAVSHPPPAVLRPFCPFAKTPKFIANPWVGHALAPIGHFDHVLIIGTALSTADVIASLQAQGHKGQILAISRRGFVSRIRIPTPIEYFGDFSSNPSRTVITLLKATRAAIREAAAAGIPWGPVMDALRVQGLTVWSALPPLEKRRFLRHLRVFWDVHRYQVAPQLAAIMQAQCAAGVLEIRAARVLETSMKDKRFHVTLKNRRETAVYVETFDAIINCTGPDHGSIISTSPVLASLVDAGFIKPDPYGLGFETDQAARAIDATANPVQNLLIAGPLARATFGELMGLPQVSHHAALVASQITILVQNAVVKK